MPPGAASRYAWRAVKSGVTDGASAVKGTMSLSLLDVSFNTTGSSAGGFT
ncbi:hypothetical protein [Nostoc commune]|nr:hypothetical protein [Nostoc commune]